MPRYQDQSFSFFSDATGKGKAFQSRNIHQIHNLLHSSSLINRRLSREYYFGSKLEKNLDIIEEKTPNNLSLSDIASKLKFEIFDLDEGRFGLESKDKNYGIEIIRSELKTNGGLGIQLEELASGNDGRGMCLVSNIIEGGNADQAEGKQISPGDMICYIGTSDNSTILRTEGFNLDRTLDSMTKIVDTVKEKNQMQMNKEEKTIFLVVKRLIKLAKINVTFVYDSDEVDQDKSSVRDDGGPFKENTTIKQKETTIPILAGSNLRKAMMSIQLPIYNTKTKRYDQPYITGNCGGEGICGTCLVQIIQGNEHVSQVDEIEKMSQEKWRAINWRLSCRTVIGPENKEGNIKIKLQPQKRFQR